MAAGAPELAGTELAAVAGARFRAGSHCGARQDVGVVVFVSWRRVERVGGLGRERRQLCSGRCHGRQWCGG